jgi:hypothetical protein
MRHAANECRVIDTVTAAPPPSDRERLATASPLPWGAIQLFDLRGLLTAPGARLSCANAAPTGRGQVTVRKVAPDEPSSRTPDYSGLSSCRFFVGNSAPSPRKCYLGRKPGCTRIGRSNSGHAHSTTKERGDGASSQVLRWRPQGGCLSLPGAGARKTCGHSSRQRSQW